jgi:hypothetical protein
LLMSITIAGIGAAADPLADSSSAAERIEFVEQSRRAQANTPRGLAAELYAERRRRAAAADPGAALQLEEIIVEGTRLPKELQPKKKDAMDALRRALEPNDRGVSEEVHSSGNVSLYSGGSCTCFRNYARNVWLPQSDFRVLSVPEQGNCN